MKIFIIFSIFFFHFIATSAQKSKPASFGITVSNKTLTNTRVDAALSTIFKNFNTIAADPSFETNIAMFETNVQTIEIILTGHQTTIINLMSGYGEKVQRVRNSGGDFEAFCDKILGFLDGVASINDFGNATGDENGQNTPTAASRVATIKQKYLTYLQIQLIAAKNVTKLNFFMSKMEAWQGSSEAIGELSIFLVALKGEIYQYASACGTSANKILTLQYDIQFKYESCSTGPECGEKKILMMKLKLSWNTFGCFGITILNFIN
jgi:hypothetical protein